MHIRIGIVLVSIFAGILTAITSPIAQAAMSYPSAPLDVRQEAIEGGIRVRWALPADTAGNLSGYQIEYSTINLTYSKLVASKYGFFNRIILAIKQGWDSFLSALVFLISLWPYYLLLFTAYFLFKWIRKLRKK